MHPVGLPRSINAQPPLSVFLLDLRHRRALGPTDLFNQVLLQQVDYLPLRLCLLQVEMVQ